MTIEFVSLKCPSCGGRLDVYKDMEFFSCGYCGTETIVDRRGGAISLKAQTEAIEKVQKATDKTAAELALKRLPEELGIQKSRMAKLVELLDYKQQWADLLDREKVWIDPADFTSTGFLGFGKVTDTARMEKTRMQAAQDLERKRKEAHAELAAVQAEFDEVSREIQDLELRIRENRRIANS